MLLMQFEMQLAMQFVMQLAMQLALQLAMQLGHVMQLAMQFVMLFGDVVGDVVKRCSWRCSLEMLLAMQSGGAVGEAVGDSHNYRPPGLLHKTLIFDERLRKLMLRDENSGSPYNRSKSPHTCTCIQVSTMPPPQYFYHTPASFIIIVCTKIQESILS